MILTFNSGKHSYQLRPHDGGVCWRVWKKPTKATGRNGKPIKEEWVAMDLYPRNIQRGVVLISELLLKESETNVEINCGDCVTCQLGKTIDDIVKKLGA